MQCKLFAFDHLVERLLLSGFLKVVSQLGLVVKIAVRIALPEGACQSYVHERLRNVGALPSGTTIRRHQLVLHIAWLCKQQRVMEEGIQCGGLVRRGTIDSSRQHGFDSQCCGFLLQ